MQECIQNVVVIKSFSNENVISKKADDVQYQDFKLQIKRSYINIIAKIISPKVTPLKKSVFTLVLPGI